jgi:hypothetical protein
MTLPVVSPFPFFTDLEGKPLEGGFIYLGSPNLNPETNPVSVFWDSAGTIPAAQPIRTIAGMPARYGTPTVLYVAGDYSVTVRNSRQELVYTTPTSVASALSAAILSVISGPTGAGNVGFQAVGGTATTVLAKLRELVSVTDYGAKCDGVTDDTAALVAADTAARSLNRPLYIPGPMNITTPTTIRALIIDTLGKIFTTNNNVTVASGQVIRPEWWGADPTNTSDSLAAFNACLANAKGRTVELSGGYKFSGPLLVDYADGYGLTIRGQGAAMITANGLTYNKCFLNFDGIAAGSKALTFKGVRGLVLENFFVSHKTSGTGGGTAVWLTQLDVFRISRVDIESQTGSSGAGFQFGATNGVDCAFMGLVEACEVFCQGGASFGVYPACTSITFLNCYQEGGYFFNKGSVYTTYITCASEGAPLFGYILNGTANTTFVQCAGEANGRGVFYLQSGCSQTNLISPFGAGNNTSNIAVEGDLVFLDGTAGANTNVLITSPTSLSSGSNTTSNIGATGTNGYTEIQNIYSPNLPKGLGGSQVWKTGYLVTTGDLEVQTFTPVITNWTNVGTPTITAKLVKKGKLVTFTVKVAPGTSIKSVAGSSYISLPVAEWGGLLIEGAASVVDSNAATATYGSALITTSGTVWLPSFGPLTVPVIITGTVMVN